MPLSPSMNVMALRQLAVFMKAGSYVMRPKSSGEVFICLRSTARMVPSSIGSSYVFPVRLSTIVSVSAIGRALQESVLVSLAFRVFTLLGLLDPLAGKPVRAVGPPRQILQLAALAAERSPAGVHSLAPAEHAEGTTTPLGGHWILF